MKSKEELLKINEEQRAFYNENSKKRTSLFSELWRGIRNGPLNSFQKRYDLRHRMYLKHKQWMGDLSDKKVLDLGCLRGNALSLYMAEHAKFYVGIDLSEKAIADLQEKLSSLNSNNAKAVAVDFLSDDFIEKDFDLIYAFGVLHHFQNFDILLKQLVSKLKPNGEVISFDPLETSKPVSLLRKIYRPFQEDKDWEWPFKKSTFDHLKQYFEILELRGFLGRAKYGFILHYLPFPSTFKDKWIKNQIERDWRVQQPEEILNCMQVTMHFKVKQ